jgi:chromate transporter
MSPWTHGLAGPELWALFGHFTLLSLLAVGGAIATAPDMQRFVVGERGWLSDAQFTASVALAQAAPGPNVLFVAVVGWNAGGVLGAVAALAGSLVPSATLALAAGRSRERYQGTRTERAFSAGLAPLTLGLLVATSWVLLEPVRDTLREQLLSAALVTGAVAWMMFTRQSPLWAVALGAVVGALGWL